MRDDPTVVALVERAREGDQDAWDQIVRRYAALVWSLCRYYGLSEGDIDDVGAYVWLRLVERLSELREPAALPGWIATTTQRECMQMLRMRTRVVPIEHEQLPAAADPPPDDLLLNQERHIALRSAFAELPERCRRLLSMLFGDPPTHYDEISRTLGLKVPSIGPTRMRCLDKLRQSPPVAALMDTAQVGRR
jgi:RNA polymerase sigma factor (sigma-70 family)